ncbi:PstC family ABC transporter permease, partial [Mycobacterium sp.]|uniref:PstC family ABC transporter permease n=1 Tax=Mycobacterium sp. TaxID=1785 RepID=UPI003C712765
MAITPDSSPVGSATPSAGPPGIGDTREVPAIRIGARHRDSSGRRRWEDPLFRSVAIAAGATIVAAIALMGLFLLIRAVPSLQANHANFITSSEFKTTDASDLRFGIRDLFQVTVLSSVFALVIAVPIAIGIAAFLTNYAPRRLARPFAILVDLLAAVPSIVFGLWGIFVLAPWLRPVAQFLNDQLGWLFLFAD